jgi:hypothetical protein
VVKYLSNKCDGIEFKSQSPVPPKKKKNRRRRRIEGTRNLGENYVSELMGMKIETS